MLPIMMQAMHPEKFTNDGRTVTPNAHNTSPVPPPLPSSPPPTQSPTTTITSSTIISKTDGLPIDVAATATVRQGVESPKVKDFDEFKNKSNCEAVSVTNKHEFTTDSSNETTNPPSSAASTVMPLNHELIRQTHTKMANKFAELEAKTGICLRSCSHDNCKQTDVTDGHRSTFNTNNQQSVISNGNGLIPTNISESNRQLNQSIMSTAANGMSTKAQTTIENDEIEILREDLRIKNEYVEKLLRIRSEVESELQDLTASLFEEANKMVQDANVLRQKAENDLKDTSLQMEVLAAENVALKNLVIHSTPSTPKKNPSFLHAAKKRSTSKPRKGLTGKSPSNYELGANDTISSNGSSAGAGANTPVDDQSNNNEAIDAAYGEMDPIYYKEFKEWRKHPDLDPQKSAFMKRIYDEDIYTVFNFRNKDLTYAILRAIERNTLTVERTKGDMKDKFPRKCKLLDDYRSCIYRMRVDEGQWYYICSLSRERITTVCDLLCYLRYVKDGLVKSQPREIYWQIMLKRHSIVKAKLGLLTN